MAPDPRIITPEEFAAYLGRQSSAGAFDPDVAARQIVAAENYVESRIPYELAPTVEEARVIHLGGESFARLPGGLRNETTVTVGGSTIGYRTLARHGLPAHSVFLSGWGAQSATITGDWGFEECPEDLRNGILALAARDHFIRLNRGADVTQTADGGGASYYDRIPTATRTAIARYELLTV